MAVPAGQSYNAYNYHFNGIGSTVAMTDNNQTIVNSYAYSPFRNVFAQSETIPQPFKFVGKYGVTSETGGLYHIRARYYDPEIGRFISEDPIGFEGGDVNLYGYVGNNPVMRVDPEGLDWLYQQSTGQLSYQPPDFAGGGPPQPIATGYSGYGDGLNNPSMQHVRDTGPIPQGAYTISRQQTNVTGNNTKLPGSMRLTPQPETDTYGRSGFLIHGGNFATMNSSMGCIILQPGVRDLIGNSGDATLKVYK